MVYISIPKDLDGIKTKVAFSLTRRQLIGFPMAELTGILAYLFMKKYLLNDVFIIVTLIVILLIFFIALYEKDTLTFEKYFKFFYLHKFYQPTKGIREGAYIEVKEKANQRLKSKGKTIGKRPRGSRKTRNKERPNEQSSKRTFEEREKEVYC